MRIPSASLPSLVLAVLLAASCGEKPAPVPAAPGAAGGAASPAAAPPPAGGGPDPLAGFTWDPDELLALPAELVAQPGTGDTWIEGVVEDPEGKPLPGALVTVEALPYGASPEVPAVHATATTGPDGRFRAGPGPTPWAPAGLVHASAPGFARTSLVNRATAAHDEPWAEPGMEVRIRLRPGVPVKGVVRGEDGGVPDGPVILWVVGATLFSEVVRTDANGGFSFTAPEGPLTVTSMEGAHPMARSSLLVQRGAENFVQVTVRRGRDVPVRILDDETGKPAKGVVIRTFYGHSTVERVPDSGEFLLKKYWYTAFQARAPGLAAKFNYIPADAGTPENPVMTVRLQRGFVARGRVLDLEGLPLPGIRVRCYAKDSGGDWVDIIGGTTRADGSYTIVGLPVPGTGKEIRVFAIAPGFGQGCSPPLPGAPGSLVEGVEIRIPRLVEVHGRVEDGKGLPVEVGLEAQWKLAPGLSSYLGKIPDRAFVRVVGDATFRTLLPERTPFVLRARADAIEDALVEGVAPAHPGPGKPVPASPPVVVRVNRGATLRGAVVDAAGRPVERGEIRVEPSPPTDPRPSKDGSLAHDGTFEIGGLAPGLYDLSVLVHPEFLQEVVLGATADGEPVRVVLRRPGGVVGRVLPPEDAPTGLLAEISVRALGPTRPLPPELTLRIPVGTDFRLGPLAPGPYSLDIVAGDRRLQVERIVVEDGGAFPLGEVALEDPTGILQGTVRVAGRPAAGVPVEVLRHLPGGRFESAARASSGPGGVFRVAGLLDGLHRIVVHPQDRPLVQKDFESRPGEPATLDVDVPAGGVLVVRVVDGEGRPVAGARVVLQGPAGSLLFWKAGVPGPGPHGTGEDGVLRCAGVAAGEVRVVADLPGAGSGEATVVVEEGGEGTVEVGIRGK